MQKRIHEILNELGIPFSVSGREFLETAIELIYENGRMGMTKELYPLLGQIFNKPAHQIERSIRVAIERSFDKPNMQAVEKFFGNTVSPESGKLVNSEFIYGVAKYLKIYS